MTVGHTSTVLACTVPKSDCACCLQALSLQAVYNESAPGLIHLAKQPSVCQGAKHEHIVLL